MDETRTYATDVAYDLTSANNDAIKAGPSWSKVITYYNANGTLKDFTGYTGYMQIRTSPNGVKLADVTVALGGALGTVTLTMTSAQTLALMARGGVYDLYIRNGNTKICLLYGNAEFISGVTDLPPDT